MNKCVIHTHAISRPRNAMLSLLTTCIFPDFVPAMFHDLYTKDHGMCYPVRDGAYKTTLAANRK